MKYTKSNKNIYTSCRNCYVNNPYPSYQPLKKGGNPPPRIINALRAAARNNNPSQHPIWYTNPRYHAVTHKLINRERKINLHRCRAINAIMECIAAHVNIITNKVFMTLGNISDSCGLTTYNKKGKPCYSRVSRAINEHIEAIGAVHCERIWDNTTKSYIPNIIWITELFLVLIDYKYSKFLAAQKQQLAWENQKLKYNGMNLSLSIQEARCRAKIKHIEKAFEIRAKRRSYKNHIQHISKLMNMEQQMAKAYILNNLIKLYSKEELAAIGYIELRKQVDRHYFTLRKLASSIL